MKKRKYLYHFTYLFFILVVFCSYAHSFQIRNCRFSGTCGHYCIQGGNADFCHCHLDIGYNRCDGTSGRFAKECINDRFTDSCECECADDGSATGYSGSISYHLKIGDRYITETYGCAGDCILINTPTPTPTPSPTPPDGGGECPCGDCVYGCCGNGLNELDPGCGCDGDECCGQGTHTECTGGDCEPAVEICAYDPYTGQVLGDCVTYPGECEPEFCVEVCN